MEYLGIFWLTSWLMELFGSRENLLAASEYVDKRSAGNVLSVADQSDRTTDWQGKPRPETKQNTGQRKPSPESITFVEFKRSLIEPLLHPLNSRKSEKSELCRSPEQITTQTQLSSLLPVLAAPTSSSSSIRLISQKAETDDPTQTMPKWMEDILPFSGTDQSRISAEYPAVQVLRVNTPNPDSKSRESTVQYEIRVQGCVIGTMPHPISAHAIGFQLRHLLQNPNFDPRQIRATMIDNKPAVQAGSQLLFVVDPKLGKQLNRHPKVIALEWINNLRKALGISPLTFAETQVQMYGLVESNKKLTGLASWYGPYFHGRLTANGEIYNQYDLTAAHPSLPFDTYLKVTNLHNNKSVIVRINDRGPYIPPRSLDLSLGAARQLGSEHTGVVQYKATIMRPETQPNQLVSQEVKKNGDRALYGRSL